ncbi:hypothetical protein [Verrucomicrobium sp. BvORR034]|uniref:hypothetical protein n=1 Tax=Verrucomicrobium sp. BvORR034 TaxID=1396418 RepID=UPI002240F52F|nr:hypothetical protein [Verrucomicrobium sp. BvORR034]
MMFHFIGSDQWQYVIDRLVGMSGTVGGRNVGLEIKAEGQVRRVSGPGFDKSFELTGPSGIRVQGNGLKAECREGGQGQCGGGVRGGERECQRTQDRQHLGSGQW